MCPKSNHCQCWIGLFVRLMLSISSSGLNWFHSVFDKPHSWSVVFKPHLRSFSVIFWRALFSPKRHVPCIIVDNHEMKVSSCIISGAMFPRCTRWTREDTKGSWMWNMRAVSQPHKACSTCSQKNFTEDSSSEQLTRPPSPYMYTQNAS